MCKCVHVNVHMCECMHVCVCMCVRNFFIYLSPSLQAEDGLRYDKMFQVTTQYILCSKPISLFIHVYILYTYSTLSLTYIHQVCVHLQYCTHTLSLLLLLLLLLPPPPPPPPPKGAGSSWGKAVGREGKASDDGFQTASGCSGEDMDSFRH